MNTKLLLIYILSAIASLQSLCFGAAPIFVHYDITDGLSDNYIYSIAQDSSGYIWIGTRSGLDRFDGYSFKSYDCFVGSRITDIATNPTGGLFVLSGNTVFVYNSALDNFEVYSAFSDREASVRSFKMSENSIYAKMMDNTLWQYDMTSGNLYPIAPPLQSRVAGYDLDKEGNLWIADDNGYMACPSKFGEQVFSLFLEDEKEASKRIYLIEASHFSDKVFAVFEKDDVKVFDIGSRQVRNMNLQSIFNRKVLINCIKETSSGQLMVGTDGGIVIIDPNSYEVSAINYLPQNPYSLQSHFISSLFEDIEGNIWIGSPQNGLSFLPTNPIFQVYYNDGTASSLKGEVVHDIVPDIHGNLWIATEDMGLSKFEVEKGLFTSYNHVTQSNIRGLATSGDDLWVCYFIHGVDRISAKTGQLLRHYDFSSSGHTAMYIYTCSQLSDGAILLVTSEGLLMYDERMDEFIQVSIVVNSISLLREDLGHDILWYGNYYCQLSDFRRGVYDFKRYPLFERDFSADYRVIDSMDDSLGNLWFLLDGHGILKYNEATDEHLLFDTSCGLPSDYVFRILSDGQDNVWISTAKGLVNVNIKSNDMCVFTEAHGLISSQFNYYAALKDNDGTLYFGTVKGLIHFNPEKLDFTPPPHKLLIITDLYGLSSEKGELGFSAKSDSGRYSLELDSKHNTFSVHFSTLTYKGIGGVRMSYRLNKGIWTDLSSNIIQFNNLFPGSYRLEVRASDIYGNMNNYVSALCLIRILPPWWMSRWAILVYVLLGACIIALAIKWLINRSMRRQKDELRQLESEKERELYLAKIEFFNNVAHEIRTPLTLIKIPLERMIRYAKICDQGHKSLLMMEKNTNRLLELVNQLLNFKKAENQGGMQLNFYKTDVKSVIQTIVDSFKDTVEDRRLTVTCEASAEALMADVDREAFRKIIYNLFSNAVKYCHSQIVLHLSEDAKGNTFTFDVKNDGDPIPAEDYSKIFEPFYRSASHSQLTGTGLGLALTQFLVSQHGGTIQILEADDGMTWFRLSLPIHQADAYEFNPEEEAGANVVLPASDSGSASSEKEEKEQQQDTILVVDDDKEMRSLISSLLEKRYNLLTATNGKEAIDIIRANNVQLIVSDVIMPVMDGYALLEVIKNSFDISHIPVILLTSLTTESERVKGLGMGADAYIDKPFSADILQAQIANLLANRENIRQFYFRSPAANMKSMAISKPDEHFLEKLNDIINENISDVDLSVNVLADKLNISKPTLYRKISSISKISPNDLIKVARLKKAAELLQKGDMRVYEISEAVGFRSQSYFWSAFTKHFGVSPSKFMKNN